MDTVVLILIAVVIVILTVLFFLNKSKNEKPAENNQNARAVPANLANRNLNPNLPRNLQRNRLRNRNRVNRNDDDREFDDDENPNEVNIPNLPDDLQGSEDEETEREQMRKKIGTKKLAKLEEKAARREQNEQMARDREERKAREEQLYQERKKREEEEERLEKEKELAEKKAKEEQEKREYEEYLKLKEQFSVDEIGEDAPHGDLDSENLLNEFVNFIKNSKIVVLEDLAAEFKLKTQDAINRINQVQEMGLLTGVMDDRGKYIYLSEEELLNVKKFIEQRGRINIMELAKASGDLINLKPVVKQNIVEAEA